jgi:MIP family channel proteins
MDRKIAVPLVGEAIGTFLFVFIGCGVVVVGDYMSQNQLGGSAGLLGVALAHGITLAVVVTAFAAISGGHINPAVTVGIWVSGGISAIMAGGYIVAQLIGGAAGAVLIRITFPETAWAPSNIGKPALGPGIDPTVGIILEIVMTAILVTAVLHTAVDPRAPKLGGLLVGLAIVGDILVGGPLTGAAMNVARWFGPAVASGDWTDAYVWIVGPVVGGIIVGLLYRFVFSPTAGGAGTEATAA